MYLKKQSWLLIYISTLFSIGTFLSNTFISVYIWKVQHSLTLVGFFYLSQYVGNAIGFLAGGQLSTRINKVKFIRAGVILICMFYALVLMLGSVSTHYVYALGLLLGIGTGFFWFSFNTLYFYVTAKRTRDIFNGINGLLVSLAGILAPLASGFIITKMGKLSGYNMIFAIALFLFFIAVILSFMLKSNEKPKDYHLRNVLSLTTNRKSRWFWVTQALFAQGIREGVFFFFIAILIYLITKNERDIGNFFSIFGLISMVSFYLISRFLEPRKRNKSILVATIFMGLSVVPFVIYGDKWHLFFLGIGSATFYPFYRSSLMALSFDVISENSRNNSTSIEFVVSRELALLSGRILGTLTFIGYVSIFTDLASIRLYMLPIGFVQILSWLCINKCCKSRI